MTNEHIQHLIASRILPDAGIKTRLIETAISWVILTDHYAFKIKKPIRLPYLDFSTPGKRHHFCKEELELNRNLAPDTYLTIFPITREMISNKQYDRKDEVVEYAVQMKRLDQERKMHTLLENKGVNSSHIDRLAERIALFHKNARIIKNAIDTSSLVEEFAGIKHELAFISQSIGQEWEDKTEESMNLSSVFLNTHKNHLNQRIIRNKRRDCHGDFSTRNIYLYEDPVIINAIEYNKSFRHIDVLNEVALLCVDLDVHNEPGLSERFFQSYLQAWGEKEEDLSRKVLLYYKSYRASICANKIAIRARQEEDNGHLLLKLKEYLQLMHSYCDALK